MKAKGDVRQFRITNFFGLVYKFMILVYFAVVIYLNKEEAMKVYKDSEEIRMFAGINLGHYFFHLALNLVFIFGTKPSNIHRCQICVC